MSKTNSIVEINGNRYDAITGQLLSPVRKITRKSVPGGKRMIDGFVNGAHHKSVRGEGSKKRPAHHPAQSLHGKHQGSKTLMRGLVKKPAVQAKKSDSHDKTSAHHPGHSSNHKRQFRAQTVSQHQKVKRFGLMPAAASAQKPAPAGQKTSVKKSAHAEVLLTPPMPSMVASASHQQLERMLDEALMKANAHKHMLNHSDKPTRKIGRLNILPRWLNFAILILVIVSALAFGAWHNIPSVSVKVASARAKVDASLPSYIPAEFGFAGPPSYKQGSLTMHFQHKTDENQNFEIIQKASGWNSISMVENTLPKNSTVQTSQVNGTTVYIYGNSNDAAWMDRGIFYTLKDRAGLSSDQVLKIVEGL